MFQEIETKLAVKTPVVLQVLLGVSLAFLFSSAGMAAALFSIKSMAVPTSTNSNRSILDVSATPKGMADIQILGYGSPNLKTSDGKQITPGDYVRVSLAELANGDIKSFEPLPSSPIVCADSDPNENNCAYDCPSYCLCINNRSSADGCPQHCDCPMVGTGIAQDIPHTIGSIDTKFWVRYW